ncbi:unnamed protein product [Calypogeia fissa]
MTVVGKIQFGGARLLLGQCGVPLKSPVSDSVMSVSWGTSSCLWKAGLELNIQIEQRQALELPFSFVRGKRLSELTTWGIGGPAKLFVEVHDESQLVSTLRYCKKHSLHHFIIGKGSNCLFDDRGFDGCVILNSLNFLERYGNGVYRVGGGHAFNRLGIQCSNDGFTGLEFACGIPGTVGGAIVMNASANGQETSEVLKSVEILNANGEKIVHVKEKSSPAYGYRRSPYQTMTGFFAIVAATFELSLCPDAKQRHRAFLERRKQTQPLTERSAGCVFRNPGDGFESAGALIEQAGLKGFSVGQAKVSDVHANFLVNAGGARAVDMLALIRSVKEQVYSKFGMELTEEIIYIPYS